MTSGTPTLTDPADVIPARTMTVIDPIRADEFGGYRWIKRFIAATVQDYHVRFLHELVQNGFDAPPETVTTGRSPSTSTRTEGDHGVLYVANGGQPLTYGSPSSQTRSLAS